MVEHPSRKVMPCLAAPYIRDALHRLKQVRPLGPNSNSGRSSMIVQPDVSLQLQQDWTGTHCVRVEQSDASDSTYGLRVDWRTPPLMLAQ